MWWECDCGNQVCADPTGHTDYGGAIRVQGPTCEECGQPMALSADQDEE